MKKIKKPNARPPLWMLKLTHRYNKSMRLGVFLSAGVVTGIACVFFMWAFEFVLRHRLDAARIGPWIWLTTPAVFVLSIELIRRFAPYADGAGVPQTVFAAAHLSEVSLRHLKPLVSFRTMAVKIAALLLAVWVGASTGREGPTVHVAACLFLGMILFVQRLTGLKLDLRSAVVAGGAAGLAAAFNTPLAGVTFAIEELSSDYFASIKEFVLLAIIVAGISAKSLIGEYAYFGRLESLSSPVSMSAIFLIGIAGGLCGAFFSSILVIGRKYFSGLQRGVWRYAIPALFAVGILTLNLFSASDVTGPGNKVAQLLITTPVHQGDFFPLWKTAATLFTYWAGIAGGIFAPCLAIGASLGADVGLLTGAATMPCALIGMAAFLAGTIQAPMTAFVIIFEMTGAHELLLPVMLASLIAVLTARAVGAKHLYQTLAASYAKSLNYSAVPSSAKSAH